MTDPVDSPEQSGGAISVSEPVAGWYATQLRSRGVVCAVRLWFGPPKDPVTGEVMDRSHRWQAEVNEEYIEFTDVWPKCAAEPIDDAEAQRLINRARWARENAPESAYANPRKPYDPMDRANPLSV